jgi:hypothetical protein
VNDAVAANEAVSSSPKPAASSIPDVPVVAGTGKWHLLTILAGCMLVGTFFLPVGQIHDWSSDEIPARLFRDLLKESSDVRRVISLGPDSLGTITYIIAAAILPHVWGLLAALFSAMSLLGWTQLRRVPQAIGVLIGVLIGSAWGVSVVQLLPMLMVGSGPRPPGLVWLVLLVVTLIVAVAGVLYALLAVRRRSWAYLYHGFAGAGELVLIFAAMHVFILLTGWTSAGRYVGLSGMAITTLVCCLLLFSRIGEARVVTGLTWRRTFWYLLTLRLHKATPPVGLCPKCGYYLYGLREQRCPECGRPFSFEEVDATPESLGFVGELRAKGGQDVLADALPEGR